MMLGDSFTSFRPSCNVCKNKDESLQMISLDVQELYRTVLLVYLVDDSRARELQECR